MVLSDQHISYPMAMLLPLWVIKCLLFILFLICFLYLWRAAHFEYVGIHPHKGQAVWDAGIWFLPILSAYVAKNCMVPLYNLLLHLLWYMFLVKYYDMPKWQRVAWYHCTVTAQLFIYLFHSLHAYAAKRCMVPLYSHCCNFFSTWLWYAFVAKRCMVSLYSHCCNFLVLVCDMPLWQWEAWYHYTLTATIPLLFKLLQTISLFPQKDLDV